MLVFTQNWILLLPVKNIAFLLTFIVLKTSPFFFTCTLLASGKSFFILKDTLLLFIIYLFPILCPSSGTKTDLGIRLTIAFVLAISLLLVLQLF